MNRARLAKVNLDNNYDEQLIGPAEFKVNDFAVVDQNLVLLSSDGKLCKIDFEGTVQGQQERLDETARSKEFTCEAGWLKMAQFVGCLAFIGVGTTPTGSTNYLVILDKDLKYKTHTNIPCTEPKSRHLFTKKKTLLFTCAPGGSRTRTRRSSSADGSSTTWICVHSMERKWSI